MFPIKGSAPSPNRPIVTIGLIVLNCLVFLLEVSLPVEALDAFVRTWGLVPAKYWGALTGAPGRVDLWLMPLFSSMFLHGGWSHLIGNMLFLWVFGDGLENRIGPKRFLAFYLLVGALATQAHVFSAVGSTTPTIGASGAIAGVLGAYLWLYPRSSVVLVIPIFFWPFFFQVPAILFLGVWFVEQLMFGAVASFSRITDAPGGVAWWAHAGGFLAGLILVHLFARGTEPPEVIERSRLFPDREIDR